MLQTHHNTPKPISSAMKDDGRRVKSHKSQQTTTPFNGKKTRNHSQSINTNKNEIRDTAARTEDVRDGVHKITIRDNKIDD